MTRPAPALGAVGALLAELIDDAGLFPPASLGLDDAVAAHRGARRGDFAWMLGRFVCPAARLGALPDDFRVCLLVSGPDELHASASEVSARAGLVEAVEGKPAARSATGAAAEELVGRARALGIGQVFQEVACDAATVGLLAGTGCGVKLRCGGVEPAAVPACADLADAIVASVRSGLRLKATAGLHHPVRHDDAAMGVPVHGFLNVAAAVVAAVLGASEADVAAVLDERDAGAFALDAGGFGWRSYRADAEAVRRIRAERFAGFGSCSFTEPVADLVSLGLLAPGAVVV